MEPRRHGPTALLHHGVPTGALRGAVLRADAHRADPLLRQLRRTRLPAPDLRGVVMSTTAPTGQVPAEQPAPAAARLEGWDCIEFWVGNARTTAGFLMSAFGFSCTGYAGAETGRRDRASYVLEQGEIRFVVSGALEADSPIAAHVRAHGDGVHDLAWVVDDAGAAFRAAIARGARSVREPWIETDELGTLTLAQIATFGETVHTFVERGRYAQGRLEPGFTADDLPPAP